MISAVKLIKDELENARETFEGTVADISEDYLHKNPGGKALPIAAAYAHLLLSEDMTVQNMISGKPALFESTFKDKTGVSELLPPMDEKWEIKHARWAKTVQVDLEQLRVYAKAVYAATDAFVGGLKENDLDREVDLGSWGKKPVAYLLYAFVIGHTNNLAGEISAIKGVFGAKGYPF